MNVFVYSDESGVFDKVHNDYFVFGGLIFLGKEDRDIHIRKYSHVEKIIRDNGNYKKDDELKASFISNKEKGKIYRSLNDCIKFAAIIKQKQVHDEIFAHKKSKQRFMDYAFKMALKKTFLKLMAEGRLNENEIDDVCIVCDEHSTATNGRYELREALEQEFKIGTTNYEHMKFYPPIFRNMKSLKVEFRDSKSQYLIRAADIVANRIYNNVLNKDRDFYKNNNIYITTFPGLNTR